VAIFAATISACATTGNPRPSPFPTAPPPPDSLRPSRPPPAAPAVTALLDTALGLRGVPYRQGGAGPQEGFDCSGFVQYVYATHHINLPRTVSEQYRVGRQESVRDVRAGDLLFFSTTGPGATHVAIALNADEFVHAPSESGAVRVERLSVAYWKDRLVGARRVL
jgi:cell wall-associated NlpC family hydrolase